MCALPHTEYINQFGVKLYTAQCPPPLLLLFGMSGQKDRLVGRSRCAAKEEEDPVQVRVTGK